MAGSFSGLERQPQESAAIKGVGNSLPHGSSLRP